MADKKQDEIDLPSRDKVISWNIDQLYNWLVNFLQANGFSHEIATQEAKKIKDQYVDGMAFLDLTEGKLIAPPYRILFGPAITIAEVIDKINGLFSFSYFFLFVSLLYGPILVLFFLL